MKKLSRRKAPEVSQESTDDRIQQVIPATGWYAIFPKDEANPQGFKIPVAAWGAYWLDTIYPCLMPFFSEGSYFAAERGDGYELVYLPNDPGDDKVPLIAQGALRRITELQAKKKDALTPVQKQSANNGGCQ